MVDEVEAVVTPVYQVGGSVRDELLGLNPTDYDFTTPLSPDEVEAMVRRAGKHPYLIGKRFGTVGFKAGGQLVEVTTFRQETYQSGSRKPQVEFVKDITADLSRRDFTINAIAKRGCRYVDPFGGRLDLLEKMIKSVGLPKDRYKEDPLRMLRAARFSCPLSSCTIAKHYQRLSTAAKSITKTHLRCLNAHISGHPTCEFVLRSIVTNISLCERRMRCARRIPVRLQAVWVYRGRVPRRTGPLSIRVRAARFSRECTNLSARHCVSSLRAQRN